MSSAVDSSVVFLLLALASAPPAVAHGGGRYRGPGETRFVVPDPASLAERPIGPPPPVAGPVVPAVPRPGNRSSRDLGPDLSQWNFWWCFHEDELIAACRGADPAGPGAAEPCDGDTRRRVAASLLSLLARESDPGLLGATLCALAKVDAVDGGDAAPRIASFVASQDQLVAERAALALALCEDEGAALSLLVALLQDAPLGRFAAAQSSIPPRTRAFAAFGLGLVGARTKSNGTRQRIALHLIEALEEPEAATRDVKVAALTALGVVPLDWEGKNTVVAPHAEHVAGRGALLRYLARYGSLAEERARPNHRHWHVRAHVPFALARLIAAMPVPQRIDDIEAVRGAFDFLMATTHELSMERKEMLQSGFVALGWITDMLAACDARGALTGASAAAVQRLTEIAAQWSDNQCEYFALVALAATGAQRPIDPTPLAASVSEHATLLDLAHKAKGQKSPWASLALGLHARERLLAGEGVAPEVVELLRVQIATDKTPQTAGARALALALAGDVSSAPIILRRFQEDFKGSDTTRGELALALGLLGASGAREPIRSLLREMNYRPDFAREALLGLALLGGPTAVDDLLEALDGSRATHVQAAAALGLGLLRDGRAIPRLLAFIEDPSRAASTRAYAAAALGNLCGGKREAWNTLYTDVCNYRVNTPTLAEAGLGILELL
jgi:hypothetical protein